MFSTSLHPKSPTIALGGTVTVTPSGTFFSPGTSVQAMAQPNSGFYFNNWGGGLSGSANPQSLIMNAPVAVTANFASCPAITVTSNPSAPLPNATVGTAYSISFSAMGGLGSYTFSATGVPAWATFTAGLFSGTPATVGTVSITVTATDSNLCTGSVTEGFTIVSATLQPAIVSITENIGVSDTLPYMENIHVTDAPTVMAFFPLGITPAMIPTGTTGQLYSQTFTPSGGVGPYTITESGALPSGIFFSILPCSTNQLCGTPTAGGTFPITIKATDTLLNTISEPLTLTILTAPAIVSITETIGVSDTLPYMEKIHVTDMPTVMAFFPLGITPATIPSGTTGVAYGVTFSATGGVGRYTITESGAPAGISFSTPLCLTNQLCGTTMTAGSFPLTIKATDAIGNTISEPLTLTILPAPAIVSITEKIGVSDTLPYMENIKITDTVTVNALNTPAGTNVVVKPTDPTTGGTPVTLTFASITQAGSTSVVTSASGPATPSGFSLGSPPVYYNLSTSATFTGSITVCINYTGISFATPPHLFHFAGGTWVDVTTLPITPPIVCGAVTSLSPFALFQKVQITPAITWLTPAAITFGSVLSSTQLNATAGVPGSFVYTPAAGTLLSASAGQKLSVTFTPTDTADYTTATASVTLVINRATPAISWSSPAAINNGTALSASQLNATANVAGKFVYTPPAGTVLQAGTSTLSVTFTPADTTDYTTATATVTITVNLNGNLTISSGTYTFVNGKITGNVVMSGGTLVLNNTTVGASLEMTGGSLLLTNSSTGPREPRGHWRRHLLHRPRPHLREPGDPEHPGWFGSKPDL